MSDTPKKFSFAKAGAAPAQPIEPAPASAPTPEQAPASSAPANLPVPAATYAPPAFYTGDESEPVDPSDIRLPRLNIVQKSSQSEWLKHGVGSLLLKGEVKIPLPCRVVVAGARPKMWIEKTKYMPQGGGVKPRFARSLDEIVQMGGTDQWRFSKENTKDGPAPSNKPWFMPSVTLALLIEKPAGLPVEAEDHFGYECEGKHYAAALLSVKSTNYDAVWVAIQMERRGVLSEGYSSHYINMNVFMKMYAGGESGVFKLSFGEKTTPALRELTNKIVTGN